MIEKIFEFSVRSHVYSQNVMTIRAEVEEVLRFYFNRNQFLNEYKIIESEVTLNPNVVTSKVSFLVPDCDNLESIFFEVFNRNDPLHDYKILN